MSVNPVLLTIWAVLATCFLALLVYRGQLTRYEDDQLFLDENISTVHERNLQKNIVRKVRKIEPVVRVIGSAAGLATAFAVGLYVWNAYQTIR